MNNQRGVWILVEHLSWIVSTGWLTLPTTWILRLAIINQNNAKAFPDRQEGYICATIYLVWSETLNFERDMMNYLAHSYFTMVFKHWKMRYVPTCVSSDCTVLQQHYDEKNNIKVVETKNLSYIFWRGGKTLLWLPNAKNYSCRQKYSRPRIG